MKLVGATNWFIRGPFMLEGLVCGFVGSILAVILLLLGKTLALPSILRTSDGGGSSDVHALPFALNALLLHRRRAACSARCGSGPDAPPLPAGLVRASGRQKRPSRSERHRRRHAPARRPVSELTVRLPERRVEPETVIAHLGPTNSGKTHDALRFLVETGKGVYAAPLRMLAQEAHRRLAAELGEEQRRARDGRGARQSRRADRLLHRRDGAGERRDARARRGAVGRGRGARLGVDAAPARRRVPAHPAARRRRGAAARPARVPAGRGPLLRAQGAARLGRPARDQRSRPGHGRRRLQPPRRDRPRGRAEPAPSGPRRLPLRRDAARVAARGDRPLHRRPRGGVRRDRRPRARRQPAVRDAALRRDDEVRREGAARPRAVGDRADRGPCRPLRLPRARPRRRAHRRAVGAIPIRSSCGTLSSRTSRSRTATSATASSTAAACARSSPTST